MSVSWPRDLTMQAHVPATAATNDLQMIVGPVRYSATVQSVTYIPAGDVTGASGDNRTLTVINHGTGAGSVSVASLPLTSGNNLSDNVAATITLASGSARNVEVGDVLGYASTKQSAGVADPGGLLIVTLALRS